MKKEDIKKMEMKNSCLVTQMVLGFFNSQLVRIPVGCCELHHLGLTSRNSGIAHYL